MYVIIFFLQNISLFLAGDRTTLFLGDFVSFFYYFLWRQKIDCQRFLVVLFYVMQIATVGIFFFSLSNILKHSATHLFTVTLVRLWDLIQSKTRFCCRQFFSMKFNSLFFHPAFTLLLRFDIIYFFYLSEFNIFYDKNINIMVEWCWTMDHVKVKWGVIIIYFRQEAASEKKWNSKKSFERWSIKKGEQWSVYITIF